MKNFITPTNAKITMTNSSQTVKKSITRFFAGGWDEAFDWWGEHMFEESTEDAGWFFIKFELQEKEEVFEGE